MRLKSIELYGASDVRVTWLERRFFWERRRERVAVGRGTVFHYYPSGDRVDGGREWWLSNRVKGWRFQQDGMG